MSYFTADSFKFLRGLARNNNKTWFEAHRDEYVRHLKEPMTELVEEMAVRLSHTVPEITGDPKRSVFRIHRDTRFSKDKSPYKTHIGGFLPTKRSGKATEVPMALYIHIGLPEMFAAAGHYMMDPAALERFRKAVADKRGVELEKLLKSLSKKGFTIDSHETYKKVPKGYDPDHPRAEHLKRKGLTVGFPKMPKGLIASPKLVPWLVTQIKTAAPLVEWLVFATA